MKRIVILFCLALISIGAFSQTGPGWVPILKKQNFKDDVNFAKLPRLAGIPITATAPEINILHEMEPTLVWYGDITIPTAQIDANLTDDTPTAAEITAALGLTAAAAGKGYSRIIKDTNGAGLIYLVVSDGTSWHYFKSTIAI